ncbi:MAG: 16S rRNA (uracil(1498)-N(3))-methyltransferase [Verrucomicrobiota bacterium]
MARFFCPDLEHKTKLEGQEAHHALNVLRIRKGETVTLFDGRGLELQARVTSISKRTLEYDIISRKLTPEPICRLKLVQALLKSKAMDLVIQKATELGMTDLYPVQTKHAVMQLNKDQLKAKREKWQHIAIEACKQCGQNRIPTIHSCLNVKNFLQTTEKENSLCLIGSLQDARRTLPEVLRETNLRKTKHVYYMIGPEGDFSADELNMAEESGFQSVSLGSLTLRSETAALQMTSVLNYELQGQSVINFESQTNNLAR